jgi:ATP-dependent exoDNAse (exonuclease V) beta subunit
LYVATTRAKAHLHLFGSVRYQPTEKNIEKGDYKLVANKDSLLESLWPYVEADFKRLMQVYDLATEELDETELPLPKVSRLPIDRQGFYDYSAEPLFSVNRVVDKSVDVKQNRIKESEAKPETEQESLVFNQQNALLNTTVGNLVHAVFEQMVAEDLENWNESTLKTRLPLYQQWLQQQGLPEKDMPEALRRVQQSIQNGLNNPKLCWALSPNFADSATEYPLTSLDNGQVANHIVDRTFIDESGVRWIVDYKTSVSDDKNIDKFLEYQTEKYQPQLARYGQLFEQIEQRPQKWVLYFSYLDIWHELN